jgi:hypothetical protein
MKAPPAQLANQIHTMVTKTQRGFQIWFAASALPDICYSYSYSFYIVDSEFSIIQLVFTCSVRVCDHWTQLLSGLCGQFITHLFACWVPSDVIRIKYEATIFWNLPPHQQIHQYSPPSLLTQVQVPWMPVIWPMVNITARINCKHKPTLSTPPLPITLTCLFPSLFPPSPLAAQGHCEWVWCASLIYVWIDFCFWIVPQLWPVTEDG